MPFLEAARFAQVDDLIFLSLSLSLSISPNPNPNPNPNPDPKGCASGRGDAGGEGNEADDRVAP